MDTNETHEIKNDQSKKTTRKLSAMKVSVVALVVALLLVFAAMTGYVYKASPSDAVLQRIVNVVPYPSIIVNGYWIRYSELLEGYNGLMTFYTVQSKDYGYPMPDGTELIENLMNNMIRSQIIEILAKERGISVDESKVDRLMDQAVADSGGTVEDLTKLVSENYGWGLTEFREQVLAPLVLASDVQDDILTDEELQADRKQIASDALTELNSGVEFGEVAMRVSEDPSGAEGGNIGYVHPSEFGDEWGPVLLALEEGQISEVLEASEVYGILRVDEIVDPEEEDPQMSVSVIIVSKRTIEDVVNEELANAKITKLVKI